MRDTAAALKAFISGFGLPAYTVGSIPRNVTLPYITYPLVDPEWSEKATFYIQIWFRGTDETALLEKTDEIRRAIGSGRRLMTDVGILVLYPETPAVQHIITPDVRSTYLNLSLNAYHMPGAYAPEEGD